MRLSSLILTIIFYLINGTTNVNANDKVNTLKLPKTSQIVNNKTSAKTSNKDASNYNEIDDLNLEYYSNLPETIDKILPTVVSINAIKNNLYSDGKYSEDNSEMSSLGSGFIISEDGYIITNKSTITSCKIL